MNATQELVRGTLVSARNFLDANAAALGPVNNSGARQALNDAIAALDGHAVAQGAHVMGFAGETKKQRRIRVEMRRRYLQPIADIAVGTLTQPELAGLRLPDYDTVGLPLVDAATSFVTAAEPHVAAFVAAGLEPDFLDKLRGMIQDLRASLDGRTGHANVRRGSTAALRAETKKARIALKMVNAVMQQKVTDQYLLDAWAVIRRVPKKPGPARGTQDGSTSSTTPTTSAPSLTVAPSAPTAVATAAAVPAVSAATPATQPAAA